MYVLLLVHIYITSPHITCLRTQTLSTSPQYMTIIYTCISKRSLKLSHRGLFWSLTKKTKQAKELEATLGPNSYTIMDMRTAILYDSWIRLSYLFMCYMTQYVNS